MQQPCKKCGYESPEADKFCRSCGEQLAPENEFSAAPTLNHVRADQNPPMTGVGTGRFPPSVGDTIAGATERFYYPPQYAPMPVNMAPPLNMAPPMYFVPPKPESFPKLRLFGSFLKGVFFFLILAGLVAATASAVVFKQEAERESRARYEAESRARTRSNPNSRAQNAWDQMEEALKLIQEAREKAAGAGATLSTDGEKPIDLGKYAYPGAQVEATITNPGNETLSLWIQQYFDTVRAFYERQFGKPVIQTVAQSRYGGDNRKKMLFQSSTSPLLLISIEEEERGQVRITIMHSPLRFPQDR